MHGKKNYPASPAKDCRSSRIANTTYERKKKKKKKKDSMVPYPVSLFRDTIMSRTFQPLPYASSYEIRVLQNLG